MSEPQQPAAADGAVAEAGRQPLPGEARSRVPGTGHPEVDAALAALDMLDELPVADHAAVFEAAHGRLRAVLTDAGDVPA